MILKIEKVPGLQNLYQMKKIDTGRKKISISALVGEPACYQDKNKPATGAGQKWIIVLKYYDMYNIFSEILSCMHILEKDLKLIE